jgi:hypothetical protein
MNGYAACPNCGPIQDTASMLSPVNWGWASQRYTGGRSYSVLKDGQRANCRLGLPQGGNCSATYAHNGQTQQIDDDPVPF